MKLKLFHSQFRCYRTWLLAGAFFFLFFHGNIYSYPVERSDIRRQLLLGGEQRRKALWYIYQLQYNDLLRTGVMYLFNSSDYEDHRAILKVLLAYGDTLENYLPDWYVFLDQYMKYSIPDDVLIECFRLIVFWQEQKMMDTLARFSYHPSMQVRLGLFDVMSRMGNDVLLPVLLRLISSDRAVYRMYALEALSRYHDSRLMPHLLKLLDDDSKSVRIYAMEALSNKPEYTENIIRRYTLDKNNEVRARVVEIVAKNNWKQHVYIVHRALSDPSKVVRTAAFNAVKSISDSSSSVYISNQLEQESESPLKNIGLDLLMMLRKGGGGKGISKILLQDEDEKLRLKAALSAGLTFEQGTVDALVRSVESDSSYRVRLEGVNSMGLLKNKKFIPVLQEITLKHQEHYDVRTQALAVLLEIDPAALRSHLKKIKDNVKNPYLLKQADAISQRIEAE